MKPHESVASTEGDSPVEAPTRRRFLALVSTGTAAVFAGCSGSSNGPESFSDVSAGPISALPVGTLRIVAGAPVVIARDSLGVYAMTRTCTHMGCPLAPVGNQLSCGCHGSRFDSNGVAIHGPAMDPLAHFQVEIDASGNITIRGGVEVIPSTRLPVA